ncbi:hypothetical protein B1199_17340 [Pseudoalteromonas ulvae]|uniref:Uncharacterized protein n=1 Tax=Pseudoalteromonas ulvae TaxID=107327 RepID=A0A244CLD8_PSEDV|nr:hypothetical protein B1199_17340 [Pseudoalteromonas ulvae]
MGLSTALSLFRVARYITKALPCINTQQFAAKIITKDQQLLVKLQLFINQLIVSLSEFLHKLS